MRGKVLPHGREFPLGPYIVGVQSFRKTALHGVQRDEVAWTKTLDCMRQRRSRDVRCRDRMAPLSLPHGVSGTTPNSTWEGENQQAKTMVGWVATFPVPTPASRIRRPNHQRGRNLRVDESL